MKHSGRFYQIVGNILDYGPVILTVMFATATALWAGQASATVVQILQGLLIVLVLLSTTQLIDRMRLLRSLEGKLDTLLANRANVPTEIKRVTESHQRIEDYRELVRSCKKEFIILGTAMRNISVDLEAIGKAAESGKKIRLLMLDPDFLDNHPDICLQIERVTGLENLAAEVRASVNRIKSFNKNRKAAAALELRVYSAIPTIGAAVSDPHKTFSKMFFELFLYGGSVYNRPRFWLGILENEQPSLYSHVLNQIEQLWGNAKAVSHLES